MILTAEKKEGSFTDVEKLLRPMDLTEPSEHAKNEKRNGYGAWNEENVEAWLNDHQEFANSYFIQHATQETVNAWLLSHSPDYSSENTGVTGLLEESNSNCGITDPVMGNNPTTNFRIGGSSCFETYSNSSSEQQAATSKPAGASSGGSTPVRKISAQEFERGGLIKPLVTNVDGTPTFLSPPVVTEGTVFHGLSHRKSREQLQSMEERELLFELAKDICDELDTRKLAHKILQHVGVLTSADRASLFLVKGEKDSPTRCLISSLFDVSSHSTLEDLAENEEICIPWGSGIIGYVAESGQTVNIDDAYEHEKFNDYIDVKTGYRTKSLLCMAIKDKREDVLGVAQVINKKNGTRFTDKDEKVFFNYLQFCGIGLSNAKLYEYSQLEVKRNQVMLDLARMIFEEQSTIELMVFRILTHLLSLMQCQRAQILLVHEAQNGLFSRSFDLGATDLEEYDFESRTAPFEGRFPLSYGITNHVAQTGETINIANASEDTRFRIPSEDDDEDDFVYKSILCMPVKNSSGVIVGVLMLVNKLDESAFSTSDENFVEAFSIFCGMGIHNTRMYEKVIQSMAKQRVTLEVLSYHATAPCEEALQLSKEIIPTAQEFRLHAFDFDDEPLSDLDTCKACLRMFMDLKLVRRFHIDYLVLCRWVLSVKKNYRKVIYHNWRHAFNVAQMMFAALKATKWFRIFGDMECLGLLIACLCHDLDHRGTNNSYQIKSSSALAQLYSTSTMERHHFDQSLMILNSQGNQILSQLSPSEYSRTIKIVEEAIIATDLAVYFRNRETFLSMVEEDSYDWSKGEDRGVLRGMLMTACDLAAITKPWDVEKRIAKLIALEFFEQGDMERTELNIVPPDMMNREKSDQLPSMQVAFIDNVCFPIYNVFSKLSSKLKPLLDGVIVNREHWIQKQAKEKEKDEQETNRD